MNYSAQDIKQMSRRAYPQTYRDENRRSFVRAIVAKIKTLKRKHSAETFAQSIWHDDEEVLQILRGITHPTNRGEFPQLQSVHVLPMLSPAAASSKVLSLGTVIDMANLSSIAIPFVGGSGRPASPVFIGESNAMPIVDLVTSSAILGPAAKIALGAAISNEVQVASADSAVKIVSEALAASVEQGSDFALFGNAAATSSQPAGLLHGIAPITSSGATGVEGIAADLGLLAEAIGANGIGVDDLIFVMTSNLATQAKVLVGPQFQNQIFSSAMLSAGTIIAIAPRGLAVGYTGAVEVETSTSSSVHMESATPQPLVGDSGTIASPTLNAFQQGLIILKIRGWCSWCAQPGSVSVISGADWSTLSSHQLSELPAEQTEEPTEERDERRKQSRRRS